MKSIGLVAVLGLVLAIVACGKRGQDAVKLKPAVTSKEALLRFVDALAVQDEPAVVALVDGGAEPQEFFRACVRQIKAGNEFRAKFIQVYGQESWTAFQAPRGKDEKRPNMTLSFPDFDKMKKTAAAWPFMPENQGSFEVSPDVFIRIREVRGGWAVNGKAIFKDQETLRAFTKMLNDMTAFIRKFSKAIGQEGISARDIDYQMGKDFPTAVMGRDMESANTNRFDVETLK